MKILEGEILQNNIKKRGLKSHRKTKENEEEHETDGGRTTDDWWSLTYFSAKRKWPWEQIKYTTSAIGVIYCGDLI